MNQLAIIRKHLKCIDKAWDGIKTEETRKRAGGIIREACIRYEGMPIPMIEGAHTITESSGDTFTATVDAFPGTLGGDLAVGVPEVGRAVELKEIASVPVSEPQVVLTPVSDHEVEMEGVPTEPVKPSESVEVIGGWPAKGEIEIYGLAPNRRHLRGKLADGRIVTIERTFGRVWTNGEKVNCRLIRAGSAPLYRVSPITQNTQ